MLELKNVTKTFGKFKAIDRQSGRQLEIKNGKIDLALKPYDF